MPLFSNPKLGFLGRKEISYHFVKIQDGPLRAVNELLEIINEAALAIGQRAHANHVDLSELPESLKNLALDGNFCGYMKYLLEAEGAYTHQNDKGHEFPHEEYFTHKEIDSCVDGICEQIQYDLRAIRRVINNNPYLNDPLTLDKVSKR